MAVLTTFAFILSGPPSIRYVLGTLPVDRHTKRQTIGLGQNNKHLRRIFLTVFMLQKIHEVSEAHLSTTMKLLSTPPIVNFTVTKATVQSSHP